MSTWIPSSHVIISLVQEEGQAKAQAARTFIQDTGRGELHLELLAENAAQRRFLVVVGISVLWRRSCCSCRGLGVVL